MRGVSNSVFFVTVNFVFRIILQIRVDNTPILVLNFIILEINTGIMLQVPSVYLALTTVSRTCAVGKVAVQTATA